MSARPTARLRRGDLLPKIVSSPPGPRSRQLSKRLAELEAPGINTLPGGRPNVLWREAFGSNVLDVDGNRYLDLTSGFGVAAVGHRHRRVVAAIEHQSRLLVHGLGDAAGHEPRLELAARLRDLAPVDNAQTYFAVSGSDAVEIAIKTALLATGRSAVVVFEPAYHGLTLGALAATSRDEFRRPFRAHLHRRLRRLPFACEPREVEVAVGRDASCAALLVEPIVGREGVLVPPSHWLREVAAICRRHGTLLIVDEIFTGFGRTGELFAVQVDGVRPDLLCCGKAMAGGLPIGALVGRRSLLAAWKTSGEALHTATFVAHPLACAAAVATLDVIVDRGLPRRAAELGVGIEPQLATWSDRFTVVSQVRGRALLWGVELEHRALATRLLHAARRRGILLLIGGPEGRVAQIVPPLVITARQLNAALGLLEEALEEIAR